MCVFVGYYFSVGELDTRGSEHGIIYFARRANITPDVVGIPQDLVKNREYNLYQPVREINTSNRYDRRTELDTNSTNVGNFVFNAGPLFTSSMGLYGHPEGETIYVPEGVNSRDAFAHLVGNMVSRIRETNEESGFVNGDVEKIVNWVMGDLKCGKRARNVTFRNANSAA